MTGRRSVTVVPVALIGLFALLDPRHPPVTPRPEAAPELADVPIVAIRGRPLAEHEEPLPPGARVRFGSTRFRHPTDLSGGVWAVTDRYFVSAGDGALTLTDVTTGRRVWRQAVREGGRSAWYSYFSPAACVTSPDGRWLVAWDEGIWGPDAQGFRVWQLGPDPARPVRPGPVLRSRRTGDPCRGQVGFSSDGREVVITGGYGIHVFDLRTSVCLREITSETAILGVAPAAGRFLTTSEDDPTTGYGVIHWSGLIPQHRFRRPSGSQPVQPEWSIFDTANRMFRRPGRVTPGEAFGSFDLIVRDTSDGRVVATIPAPRVPEATVEHFSLSPDGRYVSAEFNNDVLVWEVVTGRRVLRISPRASPAQTWNYIRAVKFAPDSRCFLVTERVGPGRQFDLTTLREVPPRAFLPLEGRSWLSPWSPGVDVDDRGFVRRRDPRTGADLPPPPGYAGVVMDVSPDGLLIAVGDATGRLDLWETNGRRAATLRAAGKGVSALAFSPDGKRLAACDVGRVLRVWAVAGWSERHCRKVPADEPDLYPDRLTFSPDGKRLLLSRGEIMALWELGAPDWVWDRAGELGSSGSEPPPAFTPDGRFIITARPGGSHATWIGIADGATVRERAHLGGLGQSSSHYGLAVSPDGRMVATLHDDRHLRVHDSESGELLRVFPESKEMRLRHGLLRFSPDGRRLVTCDRDGHARVWEVATGQLAFTLDYPEGDIADVHFGPRGQSLITSNHREVIVWDLAPDPQAADDPWDGLAHEAPKAEQARRALLARPAAAVEFLRDRLRPVAPVDAEAVAGLVRRLDTQHYRDRERAAAGLRALGRRVLPLLRDSRSDAEEGTARLAVLVRELAAGPTGDERRHIRAVEVLEQIDTPAARELMDRLAGGDPGAVLTAEARAAKGRRGE